MNGKIVKRDTKERQKKRYKGEKRLEEKERFYML
jgi:hypothetical protein